MNKLFKYLGIGSAIGTLAYALIKYKHDEKFKEKVDNVVDKAADFEQQIKETFEETDNNIKQVKETQSEIEKLLKELDE